MSLLQGWFVDVADEANDLLGPSGYFHCFLGRPGKIPIKFFFFFFPVSGQCFPEGNWCNKLLLGGPFRNSAALSIQLIGIITRPSTVIYGCVATRTLAYWFDTRVSAPAARYRTHLAPPLIIASGEGRAAFYWLAIRNISTIPKPSRVNIAFGRDLLLWYWTERIRYLVRGNGPTKLRPYPSIGLSFPLRFLNRSRVISVHELSLPIYLSISAGQLMGELIRGYFMIINDSGSILSSIYCLTISYLCYYKTLVSLAGLDWKLTDII